MHGHFPFQAPNLDLAVRIGCDAAADTPALVTLKPRHDALHYIRQESFHFEPQSTASEFEDDHFNIVYRIILKCGRNVYPCRRSFWPAGTSGSFSGSNSKMISPPS